MNLDTKIIAPFMIGFLIGGLFFRINSDITPGKCAKSIEYFCNSSGLPKYMCSMDTVVGEIPDDL